MTTPPIARHLLPVLRARANQYPVVTVTGPRQAGKTTLCNLIARFYDPTEGTVLFDGVDLREKQMERALAR